MQKPVRRALFYMFCLVFIVAVPLILLYARGYTVNLSKGTLAATGGFFIKTNVFGITVAVAGKETRESGFLSRGVLFSGLTPRVYNVSVEKTGFFPWKKSIHIEEGLIQEFRYIVLVPKLPDTLTLLGTTTKKTTFEPQKLLPDPTNSKILFITKRGTTDTLRIVTANTGAIIATTVFPQSSFDDAFWNGDGSLLIIKNRSRGSTTWRGISSAGSSIETIIDPRTEIMASSTNAAETITANNIKNVIPSPSEPDVLYLLANNNIYRWNRVSGIALRVISHVHSFVVSGSRITFITPSGFIAESDLLGNNIRTIDRPGFSLNETPCVFLESRRGVRAVIDSSKGLYIEHPDIGKLAAIASNIGSAVFARDDDILAFSNDRTISTILVADETEEPFGKQYTQNRVIDAGHPIHDLVWLGTNSSHIAFSTDDGVFLAEKDTRFGSNVTKIQSGFHIIAGIPHATKSFLTANERTLQKVTLP